MEEGKPIEFAICVCDSDGNALEEFCNVDEAIRHACETVIDTWPDYEVATVLHSCNHPDVGGIEVATVTRVGMRFSRLARVQIAGTSLGTTVEVPVGGYGRKST